MNINIIEASEHNLKKVSAQFTENLTVVTGVSGSGKSSLVFNTIYHESRRRFLDIFTHITTGMRMTPAKVKEITGLGPAIAIGQNLLNRNPHSTLATASGLHPFFRLLFARCGDQVCGTCGNSVHIFSKDEVIDHIYSEAKQNQVKAYCLLVNRTKGSHRLLLSCLQHEFGSENLIVDGVPSGHDILMWDKHHTIELFLDTITKTTRTASIRKLIQKTIFLGSRVIIIRRNDDTTMLPFSSSCPFCGERIIKPEPQHFHGEGSPIAGSVRWQDRLFSDIMALSVEQARQLFCSHKPHYHARRLYTEILKRLDALIAVGLSYLSLDRSSPTLSRGESQRVRIALSLVSRLEDMIHILDEPTIGLHPTDVIRLMPVLRNLPGPVIFVEHDRIAAAYADAVYDLGPGAGRRGGEILFHGIPEDLWKEKSNTGLYFSMNRKAQILKERPDPRDFISIKGAHCHNLKEISVTIPLQRLTVVTGVSGSGKSSLVHHVLASTLIKKRPAGCSGFDGPYIKPVHVDQGPIGLNPRSNPATYSGLAAIIRDMFAEQTGLSPSLFSFNRPVGACTACNGMGAVEITMKYLPSEWIPCSACNGRRFTDSVLEQYITIQNKKISIADMYDMEIGEALTLFQGNHEIPHQFIEKIEPILTAFMDIGLGYITLGQPSPTLSGGEAQRVKLVKFLAKKNLSGKMIILDEPSTGLHPHDVSGLLTIIDRLIRYKATLIVVEHNTDIIDAADWIIDLGPGAGPKGGSLLFQGLGKDFKGKIHEKNNYFPGKNKKNRPDKTKQYINVKGAAIHNLKDLSVRIPKNKLTVITGVSGSGKSSLLQDILESEAKRRFYETLSMYERQGIKEGAHADVEEVTGLGISLFPGHEKNLYDRRSTVGTVTECTFHLAVLFSRIGTRECPTCAAPMKRVTKERVWRCNQCSNRMSIPNPEYFISTTYGAACTECHGMGAISIPAPEKLIINPDKPLCAGAMYSPGFFPNGYFGKEFNNGHYMLLALSRKYGFDPFTTPWKSMTPAAQHAFLYGDKTPIEVSFYNKKGFSGTRKIPFPGFYALVLDWDFGGTFCTITRCPACKGTRLREEFLSVKIKGYNIYQMNEMGISGLLQVIKKITFPGKQRDSDYQSYVQSFVQNLVTLESRLTFLTSIGLGYINMNRDTLSLSAGEAQRIKLAAFYESGLTYITILLDEPTRGLHGKEVNALLVMLYKLRDNGNTLIVVEHDPEIIAGADHIIDFGPGSGNSGGRIVAEGGLDHIIQKQTLTAAWLRGDKKIRIPSQRRKGKSALTIKGAGAYNLKIDSVSFPLNTLIGVCGVSGSGKSTLLIDTLGRALAPKKHTTSVSYERITPGIYEEITGAPPRTRIIDQSKAHVTSPLTFLDIEPHLLGIYAESKEAIAKGLGRKELSAPCSGCKGRGVHVTRMGFMPDIRSICELCNGTGKTKEAREVTLQGYSFPGLFSLTIDHIYELFREYPKLSEKLKLLQDVGLGYLILHQPLFSLSGGEAQRLKIAKELGKKSDVETLYILDEPSVGQHMEDLERLTKVLHHLVDAGNTVIICEHHPHLLVACDWLCELGPGGGPDGGRIIAFDTPEKCASLSTPTGSILKKILKECEW